MLWSRDAIRQLHACAHETLDIVLDQAARAPFELLVTGVEGFGRGTFRDQFSHVLSTEAAWVSGLQLLPVRRLDPVTLASVEDLRKAKRMVMDATAGYLDSLDDEVLNAGLEHYPADWIGPKRPPAFILMHVITHAFHHKGQMVAMLRLLGYPAPDTDLQRE